MVEEVLRYLEPERGGLFVDCTVGLGGHARALLAGGPRAQLVGVDRDPEALEIAATRLAEFGERARLRLGRFGDLEETLAIEGIDRVDGILADLGLSSLQLETARRGFSFQRVGPLDMRMGPGGTSAADIVNEYSEDELREIFETYGEDRKARRVAHAIVERRQRRPISSTEELRELVHRAKSRRREGRVDSATRIFQALRIEANQELTELRRLLDQMTNLLDQDGRIVIISYHSLEDREVKHRFRELSRGIKDPVTGRPREETRLLELLTRGAVEPRPEEVKGNPRARSAKLRAARRLPTPGAEETP